MAMVALPAGITTCTVTFGNDLDFSGVGVSATMVVTPLHDVVWKATGQRLVAFPLTARADRAPGSISLPVVDQDGFEDGNGNDYKMWSYKIVVNYTGTTGGSDVITKNLQPLMGQTTIDFDRIPDGGVTPGVTAPQIPVVSVGGLTGVITVEDLEALGIGGGTPGSLAAVATSGSYTDLLNKPVLAAVAVSGAYADLTGKPSIPGATVATTGAYADLIGKPALATVATSGAYADLTGRPTLATVATSGSYADLLNKPTIPGATVATTGAYADLIGKPALAAVATSGAYADLTGKPVLATVAISGAYADLTGRPTLATVATTGAYADLTGKPTIPASTVWNVRKVTAAATAANYDYILADTTTTTFAITAPAPVSGGRWGAKWIAGSTAPTFAGTIAGTATFVAPDQAIEFISDGTTWYRSVRPSLVQLPDYLGPYEQTAKKGTANGYASLDGNGLVPTAQLPASATVNEVRITSNQALAANNVAMQNVTGLSQPIGANEEWDFDCLVFYDQGSATSHIKIGLALPTGATVYGVLSGMSTVTTADNGTTFHAPILNAALARTLGGTLTGTTASVCRMYGKVINGATAGAIQVQAAQSTLDAATNPTIYAGSWMTAAKVV